MVEEVKTEGADETPSDKITTEGADETPSDKITLAPALLVNGVALIGSMEMVKLVFYEIDGKGEVAVRSAIAFSRSFAKVLHSDLERYLEKSNGKST
jgi:hypothetical protein